MKRRHIFFSIFLVCILFVITGCVKKETPKKVSLSKKSPDIVRKPRDISDGAVLFGFDLRLGPKEEIRIYTPFLKYLEHATNKHFRLKFTEKYEDTVENLGTGVTDFAAIGSLSYVIGREEYGIRYLASGVNREGDPRYQAMIVTRPESGIHDVRDLRGRAFAFGSRMSTQGHLIPRKMLEDAGITLKGLRKYIYTGSHLNAVKAVLNGECDAAGIQDTLAKRLIEEGKIKIIKTSIPYPSSLIAYNSAVDSRTVETVKSAMLAFEPMGKHKDMLFDWDKTEMSLGFVTVDESEIERMAELARKYGIVK